jgi:hypothetical protein
MDHGPERSRRINYRTERATGLRSDELVGSYDRDAALSRRIGGLADMTWLSVVGLRRW